MEEKNRAGFIRWHDKTIEQMGFLNNLLIGITTGELYLGLSMIIDNKTEFISCNQMLLKISLLSSIVSLVIGCYLACNRLWSFRITMHIARDRGNIKEIDIIKLRRKSKTIDYISWILIRLQTGFFLACLILEATLLKIKKVLHQNRKQHEVADLLVRCRIGHYSSIRATGSFSPYSSANSP